MQQPADENCTLDPSSNAWRGLPRGVDRKQGVGIRSARREAKLRTGLIGMARLTNNDTGPQTGPFSLRSEIVARARLAEQHGLARVILTAPQAVASSDVHPKARPPSGASSAATCSTK